MSISLEEVDRIAKLSRLTFIDSEKQKLQHELSSILEYVDQLKQVEGKTTTEKVDPDSINLMRDDIAIETGIPEEFLNQAPDRQGNLIKAKSVLE